MINYYYVRINSQHKKIQWKYIFSTHLMERNIALLFKLDVWAKVDYLCYLIYVWVSNKTYIIICVHLFLIATHVIATRNKIRNAAT